MFNTPLVPPKVSDSLYLHSLVLWSITITLFMRTYHNTISHNWPICPSWWWSANCCFCNYHCSYYFSFLLDGLSLFTKKNSLWILSLTTVNWLSLLLQCWSQTGCAFGSKRTWMDIKLQSVTFFKLQSCNTLLKTVQIKSINTVLFCL